LSIETTCKHQNCATIWLPPTNTGCPYDYAAMEAFKGNAIANIVSATEYLREFPERVIVLKSTNIIATLRGRRCGFTRRMVDKDQTRGFPEWCGHLMRALAGDQRLQGKSRKMAKKPMRTSISCETSSRILPKPCRARQDL